jgi:methyltransferase
MIFIIFILFIIFLRILELLLSKSNEKWLLQNNAVEYGNMHYPFIVALHVLFIISLIIEYSTQITTSYSIFFLIFYFLIIAFKAWVILSLGKFWNTKIFRIPNMQLINKGPYKYFKHPNYMLVTAEIAVIPLVFHLYTTAIIFSILNAIMLFVRITEENKALKIKTHIIKLNQKII